MLKREKKTCFNLRDLNDCDRANGPEKTEMKQRKENERALKFCFWHSLSRASTRKSASDRALRFTYEKKASPVFFLSKIDLFHSILITMFIQFLLFSSFNDRYEK
jgi:hypothetical protein